MAKFQCKCGQELSNSLAPNDVQLRVFSDKKWDEIINMGEIDTIDLPDPDYDVWTCPVCQRLYFFQDNKVAKIYRIDD